MDSEIIIKGMAILIIVFAIFIISLGGTRDSFYER